MNNKNVGAEWLKREGSGMGLSVERDKSVHDLQNQKKKQKKRNFDFIMHVTTFSTTETQLSPRHLLHVYRIVK